MTAVEAIANAVRLLEAAEDETDRDLVEQYRQLADSWLLVGQLILDSIDSE